MGKIFVSYLRCDKDQVARLVRDLSGRGADIWWDEDSLAVGDHWQENIEVAIRECEYFIPCFSKAENWPTSTMEREVQYAADLWSQRAASDSKWILPVKLEDCSIPKVRLDSRTTLDELHWIRIDGGSWYAAILAIDAIVLKRKKDQARKELVKLAEASARASARADYASVAAQMAHMNREANTNAGKMEADARHLRDIYLNASSAYLSKYDDSSFVSSIKTDHIIKEIEQEQKMYVLLSFAFLAICFLLFFIFEWLWGVISDWVLHLYHLIF